MNKTIPLFLLVCAAGAAHGQNIYSALQLNEETGYHAKRPKKIVETKTFYSATDQRTEKSIRIFDDAGMLLTEERFDENGNRTARLTHKNDTVHRRCLERTFERWGKTGYGRETTIYSYDASHFLTGVTDMDANGATMLISKITNNEKGHPVALSLTDGQKNVIGKETATYLYDRNSVVIAAFDNDGNRLSTDTMKISLKNARSYPEEGVVYNDHGDVVKWTGKPSNGARDVYETEYVYDAAGNCTDEVIYKVETKGAAKPRKKRERRFERQYTY
ncbi:hypothetical protein [uncultured Chitinophaga sp.]|jgi:hypothetical protein|uniref:hypothetical protein n=1 Tax=uncultured Chitinophaga sp. TaxID=339340 RepID=UPI002606804A|nr:hypothetical protein [uncultured Chitinophaga sp.]